MEENIYIVGISSLLPAVYPVSYIIDALYPEDKTSDMVRRYALKMAAYSDIENRPSVLDFSSFPPRKLLRDDYTPQSWGRSMIEELSEFTDVKDIGYLGITYDVSSHLKMIPNLACQIAIESNMKLDSMPEEFAHYGCGSSLLALKSAMGYCRRNKKAAVVYSFSQSSWLCNPIFDTEDPHFKNNLKSIILFGDAAVGLILMPESMLGNKYKKVLQIVDIDIGFTLGDKIRMTNDGRFVVDDVIKEFLPDMVSKYTINPILKRNGLHTQQVDEWSIHQGGIQILERFCDKKILGLADNQISRSRTSFKNYGNLSTASSLLVLCDFFNNTSNHQKYGMLVSFGAGYYYGAMLYRSMTV